MLSLHGAAAQGGNDSASEGSDPCPAAAVCTAVLEVWAAGFQVLNAREGYGLTGLVDDVTKVNPNPGAAFQFIGGFAPAIPAPPNPPALISAPPAFFPSSGPLQVLPLPEGSIASPALEVPAFAAPSTEASDAPSVPAMMATLPATDAVGAVRSDALSSLQTIFELRLPLPVATRIAPPTTAAAKVPSLDPRAAPGTLGIAGSDLGLLERQESLSPGGPLALSVPAPGDVRATPSPSASAAGVATLEPWRLEAPIAVGAVAMLGLLLLLLPLYHRIQRQKLLDHDARAKLFALVTLRPGVHIEELAREVGLSRSTAVYHLRLLARHGYVTAMGARKTVHYYPNNGHNDPAERERRALLTGPRTRAIAQFIVDRPGRTRTEISLGVGISVSTLNWHMGRLLALGLVADRLEGGHRVLHAAPELSDLLKPWAMDAVLPGGVGPSPPAAEEVSPLGGSPAAAPLV